LKFPTISSAIAYTGKDLDQNYFDIFPNFPARYPRGYGLWSWKPYLICRELASIKNGDILLYVDGGCELNHTAQKRFSDYIDHVETHGALLFDLNIPNFHYTKADPRLLINDNVKITNHNLATILMIKKSENTQRFVSDWLELSAMDDGYLLKDAVDQRQHPSFIDHRHDQSTLTTVAFKHGYPTLPDETYISWNGLKSFVRLAVKQPILTLRNKNGIPFMPLIRAFSWLFTKFPKSNL
jgi:hypothetical protein